MSEHSPEAEFKRKLTLRVADALIRHVEPIFKPTMQVTLIARDPDNVECDVLVTSEANLDDVLAAVHRAKGREPVEPQT